MQEYKTNVQRNQHLTLQHSFSTQLTVQRFEGTCKMHNPHSNIQSIQTYAQKNDITHKQNSADHKLVTQNIKHGTTNHTTHIL